MFCLSNIFNNELAIPEKVWYLNFKSNRFNNELAMAQKVWLPEFQEYGMFNMKRIVYGLAKIKL